MSITFTKNLYAKEEVECALLSTILLNQKETALFWGLELFHTGYREEVFDYLWTIYYSFHASVNPSFEKYFIRKLSDESMTRTHVLATIITNLCTKPHTTDVYVLMNSSSTLVGAPFRTWLETKDYESIASHIMSDVFDASEDNMESIRDIVLDFYKIKWYRAMLLPSPKICLKMRFLSHIMQICTTRVYEIPKKNRLNMSSKHIENFIIPGINVDPRRALKIACRFGINCSNTLHMFKLSRHQEGMDIKKCYREEWLYYCSGAPYWNEKIREYCGTVNVETGRVEFESLEKEEIFMEKYWLEPDEQSKEVQDMSIGEIPECGEDGVMEFKTRFGKWDIVK